MENILKNYFEQRIKDEESLRVGNRLPVITISREFGCSSKLIGTMLTDALNKRLRDHATKQWKFINKEVLEEAAKKLELNQVAMRSLLASGEKGLVEDILRSFSPPYVTSLKIRKTLNDVIRTIAMEGKVVIVGRGGAAILHGHPDTLHVRLTAPIEWRLNEICQSKNMSEEEALKLLVETDKRRTSIMEMLLGHKADMNLFDVTFNCSTINKVEVVHSVLHILESKKLI
jgi:cytidylate kinase